jgi:RHS repeat-associated protein
MAYLNASTGSAVANYEYNPFGRTIVRSGSKADDFNFKFSSYYADSETDLIYYGYRYYNPELSRWLSKDPIGEFDELNEFNLLYGFVKNNAISGYDYLGLWATNIHYKATKTWAKQCGYTEDSAELIGQSDEGVDSLALGGTGPVPWGDQSYHFDRPFGGEDSRMQHYKRHIKDAKYYCDKRNEGTTYANSQGTFYWEDFQSNNDGTWEKNTILAAKNLGVALHPRQDIIAHGDYFKYVKGDIYDLDAHNGRSPQKDFINSFGGKTSDYPDNPFLDAKRGSNGIPKGAALINDNVLVKDEFAAIYGHQTYNIVYREYAIYELGTKRLKETRRVTKKTFNDFKKFLKQHGTDCCKKYFLGK